MKRASDGSGYTILLEGEWDLKHPEKVWAQRTQFPGTSEGQKYRFQFKPQGRVYTFDLSELKNECARRLGLLQLR